MKLEAIRTKRKLSQIELDEKAGLRRGTTHDIEKGRSKNPSYETVVRLAKALEVEPEKLFPGTHLLSQESAPASAKSMPKVRQGGKAKRPPR